MDCEIDLSNKSTSRLLEIIGLVQSGKPSGAKVGFTFVLNRKIRMGRVAFHYGNGFIETPES